MSGQDDGIELVVKGAAKRDAGRGIARLPESARTELGVLSGENVVIEGPDSTVVKLWPTSERGRAVYVDAETRANAGVNIGDTVTVRRVNVEDARAVTLRPDTPLPGAGDYEADVRNRLLDQPVQPGDHVHVSGLGTFRVAETTPDGAVRVTDDTVVTVQRSTAVPESRSGNADGDTAGGSRSTERTGSGSATASDRDAGAGTGSASSSSSGSVPRDRGSPSAGAERGDATVTTTGVSYEDIGGLDDQLDRVREMIELPLSEPGLFRRMGIDPPRGVLLYGPPGTGKTLIARAVANEVDAYFDTISGPEIVSKYKGESEEQLRAAFDAAAANAPAILFIDELDSIAGTRDEDTDMENRLVAQLLTLMDGLEDRGQVVVIGATNRVDAVDPALRRGGRFDREIEIGVPDEGGRREILDVHTRDVPLTPEVDLDRLASRTHGFVGADLQSLVTEAAMIAIRRTREEPVVTPADIDAALAEVDPSAMREYVAEHPSVTFADVGGLTEAKAALEEAVEWPLDYRALFEATRTEPPSGVLLWGPPGTGKTLLARALAGETDVNFIHVAGPELVDKYVGESEKAVRELFDRARQAAPTIIFLDEIDAVAARRGDAHEVTDRIVSQLLTELDGIVENPNLIVLAATNRKDAIDPALLRPGRLEQHVEVPAPDEDARRAILDVHTAKKPLGEDVDLDELADGTPGYSGADLESLVRDASMRAIRELAREVGPAEAAKRADEVRIRAEHFAAAREAVPPTLD
ncbi:AAA family ATPase [Halobacteriales archaeon QS_1_68_17]|nr:MAG: AAA family ATPase [Halobacteriales archaeon QS_1_68_17]